MTDIDDLVRRAEDGDVDAQLNLAWMYRRGEGVAQDLAEAARWHRLSAEKRENDMTDIWTRYNTAQHWGPIRRKLKQAAILAGTCLLILLIVHILHGGIAAHINGRLQ